MRAAEILVELQARHVELVVEGDRLRFRPVTAVPEELREALRAHKAELIELVELPGWPDNSRDCVRRFRRPEARLYPFLGRPVVTPRGRGRLLEVLSDRAVVNLAGRMSVFLPSEIRPPGVESQYEEPFEAVH